MSLAGPAVTSAGASVPAIWARRRWTPARKMLISRQSGVPGGVAAMWEGCRGHTDVRVEERPVCHPPQPLSHAQIPEPKLPIDPGHSCLQELRLEKNSPSSGFRKFQKGLVSLGAAWNLKPQRLLKEQLVRGVILTTSGSWEPQTEPWGTRDMLVPSVGARSVLGPPSQPPGLQAWLQPWAGYR